MTSVSLHQGDNRATLRRLIDQGIRVHSVVTDPPYGLVSIQKRFGKAGAKAARTDGNDGSFGRLSGGFMGKAWDATEIERDPEFWRLVWEILLPGGFCFAFSGSRTGHWQACAMELAGFVMHPMHGWVFGTGFPKGHNPKVPGFEGWVHGTQSQKPALEPIYLAQKPFSETTGAANLLRHGVGAVNIDGCRVEYAGAADQAGAVPQGRATAKVGALAGKTQNDAERTEFVPDNSKGRYPANLILDGSPEVVALFPNTTAAKAGKRNAAKAGGVYGDYAGDDAPRMGHSDNGGSAARFFHHFPPDADPVIYHGKAGKADRAGSKHPTVKPVALMQYLIRHITPPGGTVLDPFAGSGTTAEAARREGFDCILMEAEAEYCDFLRQRFGLSRPGAAFDFSDLLGRDPDVPRSSETMFKEILG
ncbi:site-specific DNA-methyltransferase [Gemmobacter lutimaris]|uniref:site-specific DNA-methyltransferase (adenine-specific) n=1 Tax=Gemmobacter lutimaris TaxID=2306023 RepID=A0A398BQ89_9RHOB|nr:site-specific DNA-methyltransferase [Gemmobacter lutimaris]RID91874.1 site-specific DNA-methyltransferase [Gemmobacter lutimaris]